MVLAAVHLRHFHCTTKPTFCLKIYYFLLFSICSPQTTDIDILLLFVKLDEDEENTNSRAVFFFFFMKKTKYTCLHHHRVKIRGELQMQPGNQTRTCLTCHRR